MTLYLLDPTPRRCAKYHCDRHLNECLESTVVDLCDAVMSNGYNRSWMWEKVDESSDFGQWLKTSYVNWHWAYLVCEELYDEYRHRNGFDANHTAGDMLEQFDLEVVKEGFDMTDLMTEPPWVFDEYPAVSHGDVEQANYRDIRPYNEFEFRGLVMANRYCYVDAFENIAKYKRRGLPGWWETYEDTMEDYKELYATEESESDDGE